MKIGSIVIHCYEFEKMLEFWQEALQYIPREPASTGWIVLCDPKGEGPNISLNKAGEKRTGKRSRLHLDLYTNNQKEEAERLIKLGASPYPWRYRPDDDFLVLEDPDGNLFCVVQKNDLMADFKDNFSKQSEIYSKYRPDYPDDLFKYLSSLTENHELAWDCGTGNGQAAVSLANYYKTVYASDPSAGQIKNAIPHNSVIYKVEKAEQSELKANTVDIITVAQALHWFDFDKFYTEAKRVLKANGIIAAWTYGLPIVSVEIDKLIKHFHDEVVGEFWQHENRLIEKEYSTIPFPFEQLSPPPFQIQKELSLEELLGLINSWSAVQKFIDKYSYNPVENLRQELIQLWSGREDKKVAVWKLILKVGKN